MSPPSQETLLLFVAVLLALWLLTRSEQRRAAVPHRRKPMTEDELGRVLYEIGRAEDLEAFRHLYLSGADAQRVLGWQAKAYLKDRHKTWLAEEFLEISVRIGPLSHYEALRVDPRGHAFLRVRTDGVGSYEIPVGSVLRVGRIWRLRDPVGDWTPYRWVGASRTAPPP
ncbi:MAG: hypothetical protein EXR71_07635 [Myxococcales bacterium]|nr:hypothetical protein [Myxococcales bacterium]